jgi:hypothetical protein
MKSFLCLCFLSSSLLYAGKLPWIGASLHCSKSEESVTAGVAEGVGLSVRHVARNGPLEKSGGLKGDLWWKFDGQILVSRGQLVVLLRGKKPGDTVKVEFFRDNQPKKLSLVLSEWPKSRSYLVSSRGSRDIPQQGSRRLESSVETTEMTVNGEHFTLEKRPRGWRLKVVKGDKVLFDSELTSSTLSSSLEPRWMEPFMVLQMTLVQKSSSGSGEKKRRVRYIARDPESKEAEPKPKETN